MDVLENQLMDLRMNFGRLCYDPDFVSTPVGIGGGQIPPRPRDCPPTWDKGAELSPARGCALGHIPCLAAVWGDTPEFWGSSPPELCPPYCAGEAEAGVPGAAAQEAAGAVTVPGLPALVCRAEGSWGMQGGFGESLWGLTPLLLPQLTFVDFLAYDVLDQQRMFVPECPELKGNLAQFLQRFEVSGATGQPGATLVPSPSLTPRCPHPLLCPSPSLTPQGLGPCPIPTSSEIPSF